MSLNYLTFFLLRRLMFVISAVYFTKYPLFQIHLLFLQSLLVISYLSSYLPFRSKFLNAMEIFNEVSFYLVCIPLLAFMSVESQDQRYQIGWSLIAIVVTNIGVNVIAMIVVTI